MSTNSDVAGGGSSSTTAVTAETVTGFHVLKVDGYSKIDGMLGHGRSVDSDAFFVGGYSWRVKCYPDGDCWQTSYCISVYLSLDHPIEKGSYVDARLQFSLLDKASGGEPAGAPYTRPFLKQTRTDPTVVDALAVPPSDRACHLGSLLDNKVGGDVTFEVGGELFTVHRYVLTARSSVFMAQLFGPMKEATMARVPIHDIEARVFKAFLHFIYTDSLPALEGGGEDKAVMAQHLLVAADRYGMERLRLICEDMLRRFVDASTVATTLVQAEQYGYHGLKEACFKFLKSDSGNLKALLASAGFQHVKSSCPSLLEEMLAKVAL
ncbi:unnamed protein product [Urochloa decumbens]|uniref:Uncharacterized protein n=1 Tax=Urochloa decumbens TaxID=240449 RepID=A0ABC9AN90_9POAL